VATREDAGLPKSTARNKHVKRIIDKHNVATVLCGLQTSARNRSVSLTEMESLLTLWTGNFSKKRIPLSRTAVQKKK
jgi:hypothetical protein